MTWGLPEASESPFAPSSPFAEAIASLFSITLVVCAVIGVGVTAAIAYSLFRFRARPDGDEPSQVSGNHKLEVVWTLIPVAIVTWLFVMTLETMARSDPAADRAP